MNAEVKIDGRIVGQFDVGDVEDCLARYKGQKFRLIISSPPYNIRKSYERDGDRSLLDYLRWQKRIAKKLVELLDENASLCWQVGNYVDKGEIYPLDGAFIKIFRSFGMKLRNRIIWKFNFGLNADRRFSGRYETLLWFTKSDNYVFNLDAVRIPQLYPGKRHSHKRGEEKSGRPSGNPLGKNPADFWEFSAERDFLTNPIWDFPNVKAGHPEKSGHPCQFPIELAERCVLALTKPGDWVLDPFVGVGASVLAAVKHGRNAVGIDRDAKFLATAEQRLTLLKQGGLPMRELGRPVRRPRDGERVARRPEEWDMPIAEKK